MTNPSEAIIEAVAEALWGAASPSLAGTFRLWHEASAADRQSFNNMALAAICAMRAICKRCDQEFDIVTGHACSGQAATPATNPSEAMKWRTTNSPLICARCAAEIETGQGSAWVGSLDGKAWHTGCAPSQQAATPAAPVQDGDALVARLKQLRDMLDTGSEQSHLYLARQELASRLPEIIARLTPDRVTPLVEALMDWYNCWHCPLTDFDVEVPRLLRATDIALRDGGFDAAQIKGQNP